MDTLQIIKDILEENLGIDPERVNEESTFESLDLDSLDTVELICELEDRVRIPFGNPEGLENLGDLLRYVDDLKARY